MTGTADEQVQSEIGAADGTRLAIRRSGQGRPVVLVHGAAAGKESFARLEPMLRETHTVWAYDRRGRGGSGDASRYSVELEGEDFLAVLGAAGSSSDEEADVVAHSFGAALVLQVADRARMRSLCIYEPALYGARLDEVRRAELRARLAEEEWDGALKSFLLLYAGASDDEVQILRSLPEVWARLAAATHVLRREIDATDAYDVSSIRAPEVPIMALYGEKSTCANFPGPAELRALLPAALARPLPGQRHLATAFAPDAVSAALSDFWTGL